MIVFLTGMPDDAAAIARGFTSVTREVDGPFNLHLGHWRGRRAAVYIISEGADMAYAAGRLAARRGAKAVVPLVRVLASGVLEAGEIVPAGSVWNLARLEPLLRVLPDSASEFPMEILPLLPSRPVWAAEEEQLPGIGTLPFSAASPLLLETLAERRGIHAVDCWCAGAAEAAEEEGLPFRPHMLVEGVVSEGGVERPLELRLGQRRDEQLARLLGLTPVPPAGSAPPAP